MITSDTGNCQVYKDAFLSWNVNTGLEDFKNHGYLQYDVPFVDLSFTSELGKGSQ